ncbi:MAG: helix-turn-helix transcriptional regulator [Streptosporangiaceae bacterium]|jgi:transcriptional regulator with XRE-family HTH domain
MSAEDIPAYQDSPYLRAGYSAERGGAMQADAARMGGPVGEAGAHEAGAHEPGAPEASALAMFASELRAQRQRAGWTQVVLGEKIGYSGSFVSDIERCARTPALDLAQACDREFGVPGTFERMHELIRRDTYPTWFYPVITFEQRATRIHEWEMRVIPGLLQTPEYARSVIRAGCPRDSDEVITRKVMDRMARHELLNRDNPPMLWYVLHEGVVRQRIGGPEIMQEQLTHLIEVARKPGILLQILPFSAPENAGTNGPIMVFEFDDSRTVCYTECYGGGRVVEVHNEVADLMTAVNMIRASALSPGESIGLLREIRGEFQ